MTWRTLLLLSAVWGWGTANFDGWPPARYTHDAKVSVAFVQPDGIAKACDEKDPDHTLEACQWGGDHLVLPNPCTFPAKDSFARLSCHELAHANGWPGDHPK